MSNSETQILRKKDIKVLVITPHNEVKNYCFDEWMARVKNLTYHNYDVLVADNSPTNKNKKKIQKAGFDCIWIKPRNKVNQKFIAESHEALRVHALAKKYDFVLHLESDVFPPHDIIERLLIHRKTVVSGMYFIGQGEESHLMVQKMERTGETFRHTINIEEGYDMQLVDGQLKEVHACGLGNCLIHKSVLEKIKFRWEDGANAHPDSFFAADLQMHGIKQYLDTSILSEHKNQSWSTISNVVR